MLNVHRINESGIISFKRATVLQQLQLAASKSASTNFDRQLFRRHLVRWIAYDHVSFRQIESPYFRELLVYLCNPLQNILPRAGDTIANWILGDFQKSQQQLKTNFEKSSTQVHLSFDLWSSPNSLAMLGVVGHWINEKLQLSTALLGLRQLNGHHSGENLCQALRDVIEDFELQSRLGHFMLDNATSNDVCVKLLSRQFDYAFAPIERRLRCFGHIVNLVVKALLFGKNCEIFEKDVNFAFERQDESKQLIEWRKRGPVGKLHNIVNSY
jgi:hypothetical protein